MWIERERSCFPKPKRLLRKQAEAYGTKQYEKATEAREEVRTLKTECLRRRSGCNCRGTRRQGGVDWGRSRRSCGRSGRLGRQNSCEALIQNQNLHIDDPGSGWKMLAIFRQSGSIELQIWPSDWFWKMVSVTLSEKCSMKKNRPSRDRLTRT